MPNWCNNNAVVYADKSEEKHLKEFIKIIEEGIETNPSPSDFGSYWLGNTCYMLGLDPLKSPCRGWYDSLSEIEENPRYVYVSFQTETAWDTDFYFWDKVLSEFNKKHRCQLGAAGVSEEPGCGVYINYDKTGWFFKEEYVVDLDVMGQHCYEYCETKGEVVSILTDMFPDLDFKSAATTEDMVKILIDNSDDDAWIVIEKFAPLDQS